MSGPAGVVAQWRTAIAEHKADIVDALSGRDRKRPASEAVRTETEIVRNRPEVEWWRAPVEGWPDELTIRNMTTGLVTTIRLREVAG